MTPTPTDGYRCKRGIPARDVTDVKSGTTATPPMVTDVKPHHPQPPPMFTDVNAKRPPAGHLRGMFTDVNGHDGKKNGAVACRGNQRVRYHAAEVPKKKFVAMLKKKLTFAASKTNRIMNKEWWKKALEFVVKVLQIAIAVFLGGSINL